MKQVALVLLLALACWTVTIAQEIVPPADQGNLSPLEPETLQPVEQGSSPVAEQEPPPPTEPEAVSPTEQEASPPAPASVVVLVPERIDQEWFWYFFTGEVQHIVQSAIERALINAGIAVLDVGSQSFPGDMNSLLSAEQARELAQKMGAQYMIWGQAIADKKSESMAYGVRVVRAAATITARLIRVSDGRVLASEETTAEEGGQALRAAGREALKKAGRQMAQVMTRAVSAALGPGT